jgi:hypothetical protein
MHIIPQPRQPCRPTREEFLTFLSIYVPLMTARYEAQARQLNRHDYCVSLDHFRDLPFAPDALRWMQFHGQLEHLQATAPPSEEGITAGRPVDSVLYNDTSAFCLSDAGLDFAGQFVVLVLLHPHEGGVQAAWDRFVLGQLLPSYDGHQRVFHWGTHLIKHFRQPAGNQVLILLAAQEVGWPSWLDDPLPRGGGTNPKVRLHDTIKDLNRRQRTALIQFRGDGSGTRVGWTFR